MRVAVVDYGLGNLGSVAHAAEELGAEVQLTDSPADLIAADRIVLPGVGAFADGMARLRQGGWIDPLKQAVLGRGTPILGICLGMQLFATSSVEGGESEGLDLVPGIVERLDAFGCALRIPHVGWNSIVSTAPNQLLSGVPDGTDFYFVHSYALRPMSAEHAIAITEYGVPMVAAVERDGIFGTQFHPEKSSRAGFRVLANFLRYRGC